MDESSQQLTLSRVKVEEKMQRVKDEEQLDPPLSER